MLKYIMKISQLIIIAFVLNFISRSGGVPSSEKEDIVLVINDLKLSKSEFKAQFVADMEYDEKNQNEPRLNQEILDRIIRKELLIQEAKKRGLDKDKKFITAIEKYWEATLIKQLMEQKNIEIQNSTTVSDSEVKEKYEAYKKRNITLPAFEMIEKEISQEILENKRVAIFENWTQVLYEKATIKIDNEIFTE